jgi:hypothetical protein
MWAVGNDEQIYPRVVPLNHQPGSVTSISFSYRDVFAEYPMIIIVLYDMMSTTLASLDDQYIPIEHSSFVLTLTSTLCRFIFHGSSKMGRPKQP